MKSQNNKRAYAVCYMVICPLSPSFISAFLIALFVFIPCTTKNVSIESTMSFAGMSSLMRLPLVLVNVKGKKLKLRRQHFFCL